MSETVAPGRAAEGEVQTELKRVIGPKLLFFFVIGDILGTGIYALTGSVAGQIGGYLELVGKYPGAAGAALYTNLASDSERPGWGFLLLLGLIGGAPTMVGTLIGRQFSSDPVSLVFLTLTAGSILYVIIQLVAIALKGGHRSMLSWGVWAGLVAGFASDMLLTAGGA